MTVTACLSVSQYVDFGRWLLCVFQQELDEGECPEGFDLSGSVSQPAQDHAPKSDGAAAGNLPGHGVVTCLLSQVLC